MSNVELCYGDQLEGVGYLADYPVEVYRGNTIPCCIGTVVTLDKSYVVDVRGRWVEHWEGRDLEKSDGN